MSALPAVGKLARDKHTDKVGTYMGKVGPYAMLRPVGGGKEWEVHPDHVEPLSDGEAMSVSVRIANERSRGSRL